MKIDLDVEVNHCLPVMHPAYLNNTLLYNNQARISYQIQVEGIAVDAWAVIQLNELYLKHVRKSNSEADRKAFRNELRPIVHQAVADIEAAMYAEEAKMRAER